MPDEQVRVAKIVWTAEDQTAKAVGSVDRRVKETIRSGVQGGRLFSRTISGIREQATKTSQAVRDIGQAFTEIGGTALVGSATAALTKTRQAGNLLLETIQQVVDVLRTNVGGETVFEQIVAPAREALTEAAEFRTLASDFGAISGEFAKGFIGAEQGSARFGNALNRFVLPPLANVDSAFLKVTEQAEVFAGGIRNLDGVAKVLVKNIGALGALDNIPLFKEGFSRVLEEATKLSSQIFFIQFGLQSLSNVVRSVFNPLLGQTVALRSSLLETQSALVATNRVINLSTGQAIENNLDAIKALAPAVKQTLRDIRRDSLELVGVTSAQLVDLFQILANQAGAIGASFADLRKLTISTAASLGVIGLPLSQARQEITSILTATIDVNSVLAQQLQITNPLVRRWQQQGRLIEEVNKRLAVFVDANKLGAQEIGGVTSNIQELFENLTLAAGQDLIEPIVTRLQALFDFLQTNFEEVEKFVVKTTKAIFDGVLQVGEAFGSIFVELLEPAISIVQGLAEDTGLFLEGFAQGVATARQFLDPFLSSINALFKLGSASGGVIVKVGAGLLGLTAALKLFQGLLGPILNLAGASRELLDANRVRLIGLLQIIPNLSGVLGRGTAGFVGLLQVITQLPGGLKIAERALTQNFGRFGKLLAALTPLFASFSLNAASLVKTFPRLSNILRSFGRINARNFFGALADDFSLLSRLFTSSSVFKRSNLLKELFLGLGEESKNFSNGLRNLATDTTFAAKVTNLFNAALVKTGVQIRILTLRFAALAAGLFIVFKVFDELVLQNEDLLMLLRDITRGLGVIIGAIARAVRAIAEFLNQNNSLAIALAATVIALALAVDNWAGLVGILTRLGPIIVGTAKGFVGLAKALGILRAFQTAAALQDLVSVLPQIRLLGEAFLRAAIQTRSFNKALAITKTVAVASEISLVQLRNVLLATLVTLKVFLVIISGVALAAFLAAKGLERNQLQTKASTDAIASRAVENSRLAIKRIEALRNAQKEQLEANIALSGEQLEANQRATRSIRRQIEENKEAIKTLMDLRRAWDAPKEAIDESIESIKAQTEALEESLELVKITQKELPRLGTLEEQLEEKIDGLTQSYENAGDNQQLFLARLQELIKFTEIAVKQRILTAQQATALLNRLAKDTRIELEQQLAIQEKLIADIRRQYAELNKEAETANAAVRRSFEDQLQILEEINQRLDERSRLFQLRTNQTRAAVDAVEQELEIIGKLTSSEVQRNRLANATAALKLRVAQQEQAVARQTLAIEQQKRQLALDQQIIQNRTRLVEARQQLGEAERAQRVGARDPGTTDVERNALRQAVNDALENVLDLRRLGVDLVRQRQQEVLLGRQEAQLQERQQRTALQQALFEFSETIRNPSLRNKIQTEIAKALADNLGVSVRASDKLPGIIEKVSKSAEKFGDEVLLETFPQFERQIRRGGISISEQLKTIGEELTLQTEGGGEVFLEPPRITPIELPELIDGSRELREALDSNIEDVRDLGRRARTVSAGDPVEREFIQRVGRDIDRTLSRSAETFEDRRVDFDSLVPVAERSLQLTRENIRTQGLVAKELAKLAEVMRAFNTALVRPATNAQPNFVINIAGNPVARENLAGSGNVADVETIIQKAKIFVNSVI